MSAGYCQFMLLVIAIECLGVRLPKFLVVLEEGDAVLDPVPYNPFRNVKINGHGHFIHASTDEGIVIE